MVAATKEITRIDKALAAYDITPQKVAEMVKEYDGLKVIPGDAVSYRSVHDARMMIVHTRTSVDKRRLKLGEDARKWVNEVNNAAKQLIAPLIPLENRLTAEEKAEDDRKAAIKAEAERKEQKRVEGIKTLIEKIRNIPLTLYGQTYDQLKYLVDQVRLLPIGEQVYMEFFEEAKNAKSEVLGIILNAIDVQGRLEANAAAQKEESERLEKIRKEQEAERKKIEEEARKVREEKAKLEAAQKADQERRDREEFERRAQEEAKARAEAEAKEKIEREAKEKAEREKKEQIEKARQEALRPDKEKIIAYITALMKVPVPDIGTETAKQLFDSATTALKKWASKLMKQAQEL